MKVHHVPEEKRFGLLDSTGTAWGELDYLVRGNILSITHTGVSNEKRGLGLGDLLMEDAIKFAQEKNYKINPVCPFAARYFEKYPEHAHLVVQND